MDFGKNATLQAGKMNSAKASNGAAKDVISYVIQTALKSMTKK